MLKYNIMTELTLNIIEPYLSLVLNGQKTIEGRLNIDKYKDLKTGDILLIGPERRKFNVERIYKYNSFEDMLNKEGVNNVLPNITKINEAIEVYYSFYTKEQEKEFGVLAIKIKG